MCGFVRGGSGAGADSEESPVCVVCVRVCVYVGGCVCGG